MHSLYKGVILVFVSAVSLARAVPLCPAATQQQAQQAETALADFAVNLYKNITSQDQNKNQIVSPVSVALALAMLENGANGVTRQQLDDVLVGIGSKVDVLTAYRAIQKQLQIDDDKAKLTIANGLFQDKSLSLKDNYLSTTRHCLMAQVDNTNDFVNQLEPTRQKINKWISDKTSAKIPELFKPGSLSPATLMVLANAIYFKSAWRVSFNKTLTKHQIFYKNGQEKDKENVPFMIAADQYLHGSTDEIDTLQLPFEHPSLSLFVILPKNRDGLREFEKKLTGAQLKSIISNLKLKQVNLQLPKFSIRTKFDLKIVLSQLGLANMFTNDADFGRMSQTPLKVDSAIHEGYINVNENGTEAAAATGITMVGASIYVPSEYPVSFVADHPFLYAILHKETGAIVFLGKLSDARAHN